MTRLFWLSFADTDGFRGVAIVPITEADIAEAKERIALQFPGALPDAELIGAAVRKAKLLGCNPGGQVMGFDVTGLNNPPIPGSHIGRLLSADDIKLWGEKAP